MLSLLNSYFLLLKSSSSTVELRLDFCVSDFNLSGARAGAMHQLKRLLRYARPYRMRLMLSVLMMALVGALDAFRILLIGPVLDRLLNPASQSRDLPLFPG